MELVEEAIDTDTYDTYSAEKMDTKLSDLAAAKKNKKGKIEDSAKNIRISKSKWVLNLTKKKKEATVNDSNKVLKIVNVKSTVQSIKNKKKSEVSEKPIRTDPLNRLRAAVREILKSSNATAIRCRGAIAYTCCFCNDRFPDPADLKRHNTQNHNQQAPNFLNKYYLNTFYVKMDITSLQCNLCSDNISTITKLVDHLNSVHNKDIVNDVKNRIFPFKFESKELRCCECPSTFRVFKALQEHMHSHYRNFVCDICGAGFIIKGALTAHRTLHESGSFKCAHCPKVLDSLNKKKMHEKFVHVSDLRFKCAYCDLRFNRVHAREKHHSEVHGVAINLEFKCHVCDRVLACQSSLYSHSKRHYLSERMKECSECDMRFFTPHELKKHMLRHTGVRNYKCNVCQKAFGRPNTLKEHMRIHLNDKRFKCEHCGQAFVQKCSWKGHMRSKHGEAV